MQPQRLVDDRSALDRPDGRGGVRLHGYFGHLLARCRDFPPLRVAVVYPVDLAHVLGIDRPKVAVLSAIEVVDPAIPSTSPASPTSSSCPTSRRATSSTRA